MLGTLCDVLLLGGLFFGIDSLLRRYPRAQAWRRFGFLVLVAAVFRSFSDTLRYLGVANVDWHAPHASKFLVGGLLLAFVGAIYALSRWKSFVKSVTHLMLGFSLMLLFNIGNLAVGAVQEHGEKFRDLQARAPGTPKLGPRVVWIIFDTLDYHYAFEEHASWLRTPEFDRWRSDCVQCDYALAPGPRTEISIPSLLTGQIFIDQKDVSTDDFLMTRLDGTKTNLKGQRTIFADAEQAGARTALLGLHIPYGRIMGDQTSFCRWWQWPNQFGSEEPWSEDALRQLWFIAPSTQQFENNARRRIENHLDERDLAMSLSSDPAYRLVFVHFFPPHPGGIYNAKEDRYSTTMGTDPEEYDHSLALADRTLQEVREAMQKSGEWDKTLMIVSADHSWRSAGDVGKKVYPRIPMLIHYPGETVPITIHGRTNTLWSRELILDYLAGRIGSPSAVASWVTSWTLGHPGVPLTDDPPGSSGNTHDRER